jgi:hypothetical protein
VYTPFCSIESSHATTGTSLIKVAMLATFGAGAQTQNIIISKLTAALSTNNTQYQDTINLDEPPFTLCTRLVLYTVMLLPYRNSFVKSPLIMIFTNYDIHFMYITNYNSHHSL